MWRIGIEKVSGTDIVASAMSDETCGILESRTPCAAEGLGFLATSEYRSRIRAFARPTIAIVLLPAACDRTMSESVNVLQTAETSRQYPTFYLPTLIEASL